MVETSVSLGHTPDGRRIEVAGRVRAPPPAAWDLLVDTERWPDWGPSVAGVECEHRRIRADSTGRVRLPGGAWVPFRVTAFDPGGRWRWRVARVPATGHRVEPPATTGDRGDDPAAGEPGDGDEDGRGRETCRVVFEVPPLAAAYVPVCRRALSTIADLLER